MKEWIGVDLDGTLAYFDHFRGWNHIGEPIPEMLSRVITWLASGIDVHIFTARVAPIGENNEAHIPVSRKAINAYCLKHSGCVLPVTCIRDVYCIQIWDDIAIRVMKNTGQAA